MSSHRDKSNTHQTRKRHTAVSMSKLASPNGKSLSSSEDTEILKGELDPQGYIILIGREASIPWRGSSM